MSESTDGWLQTMEQDGTAQASQQEGQHHVNISDPLSKPNETEGSKNEQPFKKHDGSVHKEQPQLGNQLQQAETNSFQLAEKETGYFGQQSFAASKVDVAQPSADQQNVKQSATQQAPAGVQDTKKGPSIPFNMLIPILQAHLDRDKDMQLQTVWAKLRRNEVHKDDFLRVIRNIVGDQMLKQAAHKVFMQMQAQAQRNNQANQSQQSLFSQASAQQVSSSGSVLSHDQQVHPSAPPNQGQKSQVSSSPQDYLAPLGSQAQNNIHYLGNANPSQNPDAKGANAMLNQSPRMNTAVSLQTRNMQQSPTQFQQSSQQLYGISNSSDQTYPRSITGSTPFRPLAISETQPSMHPHGLVPTKMGTPPTHPTLQQSVVRPTQQKKGAKMNSAPAKQDSESAGKASMVGTVKSQGKQASGGAKANKKSGGQKKSLEAAGSTQPPPSKKQKTAGAFQEQSIDQLNDVTAVSGVNLREEEEQLLSAPKEESLATEAARKLAQEEEEKLFLQKGPLMKMLAEISLKCDLKNISGDIEHCLSMCVEERLRRFITTLIRVSKQRMDTEKTGHRLVITSDVGRQIFMMNQKAKEEWDKKKAEEADKNRKQTEADGGGGTELEKEKEESRPKNVKLNKEDDDKMRATAANVAARQAVGGSDMLSKWQLMAEQAKQKREGLDAAAASQPGRGGSASRPSHMHGKGPGECQEGQKRSHSTAFGTAAMKRPGRDGFVGPQRTISVKDCISVLEREHQMTKSRLIYRLYERLP